MLWFLLRFEKQPDPKFEFQALNLLSTLVAKKNHAIPKTFLPYIFNFTCIKIRLQQKER